MLNALPNRRILLVDDAPAIHEDFRKLLVERGGKDGGQDPLGDLEATLFGTSSTAPSGIGFEIDSAFQGQEALQMVRDALLLGRPYAMAFVDMRMPPGWDGAETIERVWEVDPRLQIVICTAYSDHSWDQMLTRLDARDRLLILKKPFDSIEVCQFATALTAKWSTARQAEAKTNSLERLIKDQTVELRAANTALRRELVERRRTAGDLTVAASVFHHAQDGIVIVGHLGRIISINPAFTAITGYRPEDIVGQLAHRQCDGVWEAGTYRGMLEAVAACGRWEGEVLTRRRGGERLLARVSVSRVEEDGGSADRYVCLFHDITELRRKDERIRHLAFHDHLTDLPNQMMIIERLTERIAEARRNGDGLGILFVDLDRFKVINDSYGHDFGNLLLKEIAARMRGCLRRSDVVARIGGDEFVVVLDQVVDSTICSRLARKIITRLSRPALIADREVQVGASVGIACYPDDGTTAIELMKHADAAMYAAKSSGRGTFSFFQPAMSERIERRLRLEMDLRTAIRDNELEMRYQPKVSLATGALLGLEALVRWRHPRHGLLGPAEFLPMSDEIGLSEDLENWVFQDVFRQFQEWRQQGLGGVRIAVNVSADRVQRGDLPETIARFASRRGVPLHDLEVELTEDGLMADSEAVSVTLGRLRKLGVSIAIDDFGTGYSSLAYLHRLPIDVLKIDKSFVMNAEGAPIDGEIVKAIVGLGRTLNLSVVAEGVETCEQADFLRSCGCTAAQGFLFARPLTAARTEVWLRNAADSGQLSGR